MIRLPAAVEPVKATLSVPGCVTRCSPTSRPPGTTLTTPGGTPASSSASASTKLLSGASGGGFSTTVQPAANAGAVFHDDSVTGAFHGTMAATTPTGSLVTTPTRSAVTTRRSNSNVRIRSAHWSKTGATRPVWDAVAWLIATPISSTVIPAMSAERLRSRSAARASTSARSSGARRGHGPSSKAVRAAPTARSMSASVASGTSPTTCSVEGETTGSVSVPVGSTQRPSM